ncbi:MAG: class I SAM-dependent methyltransferase [Bradyrhizobium sp.]|nr:class I SAM-dependent methyltransferase [Bradyrhizobium sp.]
MCQGNGFYDRHIAPRLVHAGCSVEEFSAVRKRIVPRARGIVVEVGFGSGLNLPYYDPTRVDLLVGIEPDEAMLKLAQEALDKAAFPAEVRQGVGEKLPLKDAMAETVVVTYAFCTIPEPAKALDEIRRVLKPGGTLLFCEHARAPGWRGSLQRGLNGAWSGLFGGCNLTRDPVSAIEAAGFTTDDVVVERFSLTRVMLGMHYSGEARVRRENADGPVSAKREEEGAG